MTNSLLEPEESQEPEGRKPRGRGLLWGVVLALVVGNGFAIWEIAQTRNQIDQLNSNMATRIDSVDAQANAFGSQANRRAAELEDAIQAAREETASATEEARTQAQRRAEELVRQLSSQLTQRQTAMSDEIGDVKNAAIQANQDVVSVQTDVNTVRGDVQETKTQLNATRDELRSVRGDLGVQSGLIATNADQLAELRRLGERDYYEFEIPKGKEPYKIGDIVVVVKNTKPQRGKFTMDVIADDQRVEKKDRTIHEPVQFYVTGATQPYELVVNEVQKDRVIGYLAVPKVLRAAR